MAQHCIHCGSAHRPAAKVCPTCGRQIAGDDGETRAGIAVPGPLVPPPTPVEDPTPHDPVFPPSIAVPPPLRPVDPTRVSDRHDVDATRIGVPVDQTYGDPGPVRPERRRAPIGLAVLGLLAILAAGIGAFVLTSDGDGGGTSPTSTVAGGDQGGGETPGPLQPVSITATAERRSVNLPCGGTEVTYVVEHLVDGDNNTGWGAGADDGTGESATVDFGVPVHLTRIGMTPGYIKVGPRADTDCQPVPAFERNRFIPTVQYRFDDGTIIVHDFANEPTLQFRDVDVVTQTVTVTIVRTVLPPGADDDTIISELRFTGTTP